MNKFLTSVADAYFYNGSGVLLFSGKALLDDSVTTTTGKTEIRGGKGNQLQTVYYHTSAMAFKITDTQWNLNMLAATVGQGSPSQSTSLYTEETVVVTSGTGAAVTGTPLTVQGAVYGWVQLPDKDSSGTTIATTNERITFTGSKTFTLAVNTTYTGNVCVRYYAANSAATYVNVPANIVPAVGRLVLDAQLVTGSASSTSVIGKAQFIVPSCQLSGAFAINMTSAGVSTTPIDAMALADTSLNTGACTDVPLYCKVIESLDSTNWYDSVYALGISGGDFGLTNVQATRQLEVMALAPNVAPFVAPLSGLIFASDTISHATVGITGATAGLVTYAATGTSLLHVYIAAKSTIEDSATVTCTYV
jgi:hypothetical protein